MAGLIVFSQLEILMEHNVNDYDKMIHGKPWVPKLVFLCIFAGVGLIVFFREPILVFLGMK